HARHRLRLRHDAPIRGVDRESMIDVHGGDMKFNGNPRTEAVPAQFPGPLAADGVDDLRAVRSRMLVGYRELPETCPGDADARQYQRQKTPATDRVSLLLYRGCVGRLAGLRDHVDERERNESHAGQRGQPDFVLNSHGTSSLTCARNA